MCGPVGEDLFQENSIELRIQALTLVANMPRTFVMQTLFSTVRKNAAAPSAFTSGSSPGVSQPSYPSSTMHREFLAMTLLALLKADISAVYQQQILDNLTEIW